MTGKERKLLVGGLLVAVLLLAGVFAATKLVGHSSSNTSSTEQTTGGGPLTLPGVVTTGPTGTSGGGSGANQTTTVNSIGVFIPGGGIDIQSGSTGSQDYVAYTQGPVHVNVTSQPLITGDNIATVTELYGDYRKAKAFNLGDGTGYLFESTDGGYAVFNAVTIQKKNVITLTATVPAKQEKTGRFALMQAAKKLQVFQIH